MRESRAQGLRALPHATVVLCVLHSAVDLNINRVGFVLCGCSLADRVLDTGQVWEEPNNSGWVLWNHDEGSGLDKQTPVYALSQVWFALTLPTQYCVLQERRGRGHGKQCSATIHSDTVKLLNTGTLQWRWRIFPLDSMCHIINKVNALYAKCQGLLWRCQVPGWLQNAKNGFSFLAVWVAVGSSASFVCQASPHFIVSYSELNA